MSKRPIHCYIPDYSQTIRTSAAFCVSPTRCVICRLIKAFEQEARAENMPSQELANRKKTMVQELNNLITMKKERSSAVDAKKELLAESSSRGQQKTVSGEWHVIRVNCSYF